MATLVIGGDHIESIKRTLHTFGLDEVVHWGGRKPADTRRTIPDRVRLVVVVTDQLSHSMLYSSTINAQRRGLPIIYTRRSAQKLFEKLIEHFGRVPGRVVQRPISAGWVLPASELSVSY